MKLKLLSLLCLVQTSNAVIFDLSLTFGLDSAFPAGADAYLVGYDTDIASDINSFSGVNLMGDDSEANVTSVLQSVMYSVLASFTQSADLGGGLNGFSQTFQDIDTGPAGLITGDALAFVFIDGNDVFAFRGDVADSDVGPFGPGDGWVVPSAGTTQIDIQEISSLSGGTLDLSSINRIGVVELIPEPTSTALLALGGLALVGRRRR